MSKQFDAHELATVLAALRLYQGHIGGGIVSASSIYEIATDGDTLAPMHTDEIDALCERLNGPGNGPDFRALLAAILPYAESRAEDLDEAKEAGNEDPTFPGAADACAAVDAAKAALGGEITPWTIIAPYNALRELLACAELNQDDLEAETRELIRRVQTIADPLAIPSAADLRKSRLADTSEDMFAALEWAQTFLELVSNRDVANYDEYDHASTAVNAAIAKAKGEEIDRPDYEAIARGAGFKVESCADDESRFYAWRFKAGGYKETTYDEATPEAAWKSACESFGLLAV